MADELTRDLGAETELVASGGGVFEITVEGDLVFSKKKLGRFPEPGEIANLVRSR